ncbi:MAG: cache domain-containing protein, partial [Fidelibacterota bacterium]
MNFKNMTIKTKLIGSLVLAVLIPMIILAVISIGRSGEALEKSAFDQLAAIRAIKHSQISSFFEERKGDVEVYAANSAVQMAMDRFNSAYKQEGLNGDTWKKWDAMHGPKLEIYTNIYGYYDLFFINPEGDVVYTVAKEGDLGKNVKTGRLSSSPLGKAFKKGLRETALTDFEWYDVSDEPASFVSTPIINPEGRLEGVLVYQIGLTAINNMMQQREGMGETGETYLVGSDKRMRSDSFLDPTGHSVQASFEGTVQANGVDTKAVKEALAGKSGTEIIKDYNGNDVLSSYQPLDLGDFKWVIIAEIDKAEVDQPVNELRNAIVMLAVIIGIIFVALAFFLASSIQKSITQVIQQIKGLVEDVVNGRLDSRADPLAVVIDFQDLLKGLNELINAFVAPINVTAEYVDRISKGDIPEKITDEYKGDFNEIKNNLNMCINVLDDLTDETKMLTNAATDGKLDVRGDAEKFAGSYKGLINGFNETLDAIIGPLNVSAEYIDRISKGDIPEKITDDYAGDFNEIKNNLNMCIDAINGLGAEAMMLVDASIRGDLEISGDASKFHGDYNKIISGVNTLVDTLVGHINSVPAPIMIIDNDYSIRYMNNAGLELLGTTAEQLKGKKCYEQFKTSDCKTQNCACSQAMSSGQKSYRETDAHPNGMDLEIAYSGVPIKDQNDKTIGALEVINDQTAVKKAAAVTKKIAAFQDEAVEGLNENLAKMAKGDLELELTLPESDEDTKQNAEAFGKINNAVESTRNILNELISEMNHMSTEHDLGDIDVKIDVEKFDGAYNKMASGVNDMVFGHIGVKKKAMACVAEFGKGNFDAELEKFPGKKAFINET